MADRSTTYFTREYAFRDGRLGTIGKTGAYASSPKTITEHAAFAAKRLPDGSVIEIMRRTVHSAVSNDVVVIEKHSVYNGHLTDYIPA